MLDCSWGLLGLEISRRYVDSRVYRMFMWLAVPYSPSIGVPIAGVGFQLGLGFRV